MERPQHATDRGRGHRGGASPARRTGGAITVSESSLAGRAVVITGAGRGLGRSYALHLAGLGARIVVNDRDEQAHTVADEVRRAGGEAIAVVGSVSDWD